MAKAVAPKRERRRTSSIRGLRLGMPLLFLETKVQEYLRRI